MKRLLAIVLGLLAMLAQAQDIVPLLKAADRFRMGSDNLQVDTLISVFNTDAVSYTHLTLPTILRV